MPAPSKYLRTAHDFIVTILLWGYFTLGYVIFFSPFYLAAIFFSANREFAFQKLNHIFFKSFFSLARALIPRLAFNISDEVRSVRSSVIVCNHLSYLDPILFISLFKKHKTIVKSAFFKVPIFGLVLKIAGYIPSKAGRAFSSLMIERIETMGDFISSGGNLFIFPEGTRSKDGRIGAFNEGAFKIALRCKAPLKIFFIKNTNELFKPKTFLLNTSVKSAIEVKLIGSIESDSNSALSVSDLMNRTRLLFEKEKNEN